MQQKLIPANGGTNSANWLINDNGVFFINEAGEQTQIAYKPVFVLSKVWPCVSDATDAPLKIEYSFDPHFSMVAPRATLLDSRKIRRESCLPITREPKAALLMTSFIADMERACDVIKFSTDKFGWLEETLSSSCSSSSLHTSRCFFPYTDTIAITDTVDNDREGA